MPHKPGIDRRNINKRRKIAFTDTSIPTSPPSCIRIKIKSTSGEKSKYKLPEDSSFSSFIIFDDLKMGDTSCGNCSTNNHTLYQQDRDSNNGDVSSGYSFKNSHNLSPCEDSSNFQEMGGNVKKGDDDMSGGYG